MRSKNFASTTKKRLFKGSTTIKSITAYNPNAGDVWVYAYDSRDVSEITLSLIDTTEAAFQMLVPGGSATELGVAHKDLDIDLSTGYVVGVYTVAGAAPGTAVRVVTTFE